MLKAIKAIQRSYQRAPLRQFVLSQKQFTQKPLVSKRDVAMQHDVKKEVK
jgi:hypothetical protein